MMLRQSTIVFILTFMVMFSPAGSPVFAQEEGEKKAQKPTPISEWVEAENKLLDTLGKPNQKDIFYLSQQT